jgi:exopolysaccharide production protein ExoZ
MLSCCKIDRIKPGPRMPNLNPATGTIKKPITFKGIQALRGIAAVMVVVHHSTLFWSRITLALFRTSGPQVWWSGASGVDVFFVISGFVMAITTAGKSGERHAARDFLERRFLRVMPLYWFVTALFLLEFFVVSKFPQLKTSAESYPQLSLGLLFRSLFLVPSSKPLIVGVAWSLSFEIFFYVLFGLALIWRVASIRLLAPLMVGLVLIGYYHHAISPVLAMMTSPMLLEFLAGVIIGAMAVHGIRISLSLAAVLGVLGAAVLLIPYHNVFGFRIVSDTTGLRVLLWGLPAALMVFCVVALEGRFGAIWPKWMLLIGDASYSLYLIHIMVICIVVRTFEYQKILLPGIVQVQDVVVTVLTCLLVSVAAAILLYKAVEQKLNNRLRRGLLGLRRPLYKAS